MGYQRPEWERNYIWFDGSYNNHHGCSIDYYSNNFCYLHVKHIFEAPISRMFNFGFTSDNKYQLGVF